jgi:hypothetical protein
LVPLYQEAKATGDAIGYLRDRQETEKEKSAYKILYPAYGTYIGGELLTWLSVEPEVSFLIQLGFALPAHVVGRIKGARIGRRAETAAEPEALAAPDP